MSRWKKVGLGAVAVVVGLMVLGRVLDLGGEAEPPEGNGSETAMVKDDPAQMATHQAGMRERELAWDALTVEDLTNCSQTPLPDVCKAKFLHLVLQAEQAMRELPLSERQPLQQRLDLLRQVDEVVEVQNADFQLTRDEMLFTCGNVERWRTLVGDVQEQLARLGREDLLALEVEARQKQEYLESLQEPCDAFLRPGEAE